MTTIELQGIAHELKFWQGFVKTPRFINGWVANIKTPELHQEVYDFIKSVPHEMVLDAGSGACSILNGTVPAVVSVDPLGDLYKLIFDYKAHKLTPPLPIPAEEIDYKNLFDIVHISNAIDHTQNPLLATACLYEAVKPGGYLIIQGFEKEGSFENWKGFHQWDFFIYDNKLMYMEANAIASVMFDTPYKAIQKNLENNRNWYIWIQQKQ